MRVLSGVLAAVMALHGSGYGYGSGSGSGYGSGSGSGDGSGYGYGSGSGSGDGSGYDVARCAPSSVTVTADDLKKREACGDAIRLFRRVFPTGATFPNDIDKAKAAGLDIGWARTHLGLLVPVP